MRARLDALPRAVLSVLGAELASLAQDESVRGVIIR